MVAVNSLVQFKDFGFDIINEVEIVETWKNMTTTATMKLPRRFTRYQEKFLDQMLKRGDAVHFSMGYDDKVKLLFKGYISAIKGTTPVELSCEDEMFKWKQKGVTFKSWKSATLKDIVDHIGLTGDIVMQSVDLGAFQINKDCGSAALVLKKLKDEYFLSVFYRDNKLYIGRTNTIYNRQTARRVKFGVGVNIISNELEYVTADQLKIKVEAISNLKTGKKLKEFAGDKDGELHTLNFYNITNKAELKAAAEAELNKRKYDGLRGSFLAFAEPFVQHGDIVQLHDDVNGVITGDYWVDAVTRSVNKEGIRQKITLGAKV